MSTALVLIDIQKDYFPGGRIAQLLPERQFWLVI
jgi:nicotinamidase-related amidase